MLRKECQVLTFSQIPSTRKSSEQYVWFLNNVTSMTFCLALCFVLSHSLQKREKEIRVYQRTTVYCYNISNNIG